VAPTVTLTEPGVRLTATSGIESVTVIVIIAELGAIITDSVTVTDPVAALLSAAVAHVGKSKIAMPQPNKNF